MKHKEHFSIMIMRDKGARHSFRVRSTLFYTLFCTVVCLPLFVCGLGWFSYHTWQENSRLRENVLRFEDDFQKAQNTAERLENIEKLLSENAVQGKDVLVRRLAVSGESGPESLPDAQREAGNKAAQTSQPPNPAAQDEFLAINTDYVKVDNVQVRALRENRLRIVLDLRNTDNQKIAAGRVSSVLLTADGGRRELVFDPDNVGDFRINWFKRTVMFSRLSPQTNLVNAQAILEVRREDGIVVYRNIFAVER